MDPALLVRPTAGTLACAVGAVVAGAPVFSDGLRALRLRRLLLSEPRLSPLTPDLAGFTHVSGTVALESPQFSPLSAAPCAGFQLEVHALGAPIVRVLESRRPFRLVGRDVSARVSAAAGRWSLSPTAERELAPNDVPSGTVQRLLEQAPEALWWRRVGGRLRLVERALLAGSACHVVGTARPVHALERPLLFELEATGTDGPAGAVAMTVEESPAPDLWLEGGELLDFLLVADRPPRPRDLVAPRWRTLGVVAGPALSLTGLFYLAALAEYLRSLGRF